jgi:CPA1 family monovalent cation:H+ antiporter
LALGWLGTTLPFPRCLLVGTRTSPAESTAMLGIVEQVGVPRALDTWLAGESWSNDGIGVVPYLALVTRRRGTGGGAAGDSDESRPMAITCCVVVLSVAVRGGRWSGG